MTPPPPPVQNVRPYLDEWVDDSYVRTRVEHFVEVGLPVDEFQLVELLIVLQEEDTLADEAWCVCVCVSGGVEQTENQTFTDFCLHTCPAGTQLMQQFISKSIKLNSCPALCWFEACQLLPAGSGLWTQTQDSRTRAATAASQREPVT